MKLNITLEEEDLTWYLGNPLMPSPSRYDFLEMSMIPNLPLYLLVFKMRHEKIIVERFDKITSLHMHSTSIIAD